MHASQDAAGPRRGGNYAGSGTASSTGGVGHAAAKPDPGVMDRLSNVADRLSSLCATADALLHTVRGAVPEAVDDNTELGQPTMHTACSRLERMTSRLENQLAELQRNF